MSTTTMHFGPEWMRTKHQPLSRSQPPPSPPPSSAVAGLGLSTYSALVSATPPPSSEAGDEAHPFRYSKDELLRIYQEGGGKGGLGLEVERWEGVVREAGIEPITLREMSETEKKLFAGPLNSEIRRRPSQSTDFLSPLTTAGLDRPRLQHSASSSANSPLRERFGALKRRDSSAAGTSDATMLNLPRKPSLSTLQTPTLLSPREMSPRTRVGYANFDGVLNNGDSWIARRRTSEASMKPGNTTSRDAPDSHNRASGIREEKEDAGQGSRPHSGDEQSFFPSPSPHLQNEESRQYSTVVGRTNPVGNGVQGNSSPANGVSNLNAPAPADVGPPPGLIDLAAVEWSYKDPTGQVQGPFRADLMQKWYNDGYFSVDLPMKRIRYDTQWTTVEELLQRANGENIFLPPAVSVVPSNRGNGSPLQNYPSSENIFSEPFQPAPIRTLRTSALESYYNPGSIPSDSPSSSFGTSHFGNPSPDPSFNGREIKPYFGGDPTGRFAALGIQEHVNTFTSGRISGHEYQDAANIQQGPSFGNFLAERDPNFNAYGYNGHPVSHDPWMMPSNSIPSHMFVGGGDQTGRPDSIHNDPHGRSFNQGVPYVTDALTGFNSGANPNENYGQYDFATQAPFHNVQDQQFALSSSELNANGHAHGPTLGFRSLNDEIVAPPSLRHESSLPVSSTQSHWKAVAEPIPAPQQTVPTTTASSIPQSISLPLHTPWGRLDEVASVSQPAEPAAKSSPAKLESAPSKAETSSSNLILGNLGEHNQQHHIPEPIEGPVVPIKQKGHSRDSSDSVTASAESISQPVQATTKTSQKISQSAQQISVSRSTSADSSPAPVAPKTAWAKEEEGNKKNAAPSISLREIQEVEAKKLELRKAAEREKEKLTRASATAESKEDVQPFIASWGLPTSQAGARGSVPLREVSAAPAPAPAAVPVWTTPLKQPAVKKTMKEIQEEEESRKKLVSKEAQAPTAVIKRGYAETTTKIAAAAAPSPSNVISNVWTTVGPSGKASPAPMPIRPVAQTNTLGLTTATSSSLSRPTGSPNQRSIASPAFKTRPAIVKQDDVPETPSHDFLKWLSDSLKGLNSSINVEEIVSMLLSFPLDADSSTVEIISDTIYSNSTTLDGRRFAAEFVAKRKADARSKSNSASGKTPVKPVSIADVVKATPKTAQPEWGFKVVNKKKKGGRS